MSRTTRPWAFIAASDSRWSVGPPWTAWACPSRCCICACACQQAGRRKRRHERLGEAGGHRRTLVSFSKRASDPARQGRGEKRVLVVVVVLAEGPAGTAEAPTSA